ncbi:MAG TPA: DUF1501 domain-containing protein [Steroidobacteraceae bacterium]|jgi:uncharacterized protein (DUF1501 family)|nr:DUF1501 domain-containing protein [Steroidobacteraceae bacterium]
MTLSRRSLLKGTALAAISGLAPLPGLGRLLFAAEPQNDRILVVLHLRGGCDGLNLLSPASDADFIAARNSDLRVLADGVDAGHLIVHVQDPTLEFRLHATARALAELSDAKHLAFVHAAGLLDATRSHFVATDMIEHGVADGASLNRTSTGWLARAMDTLPGVGSVRGLSTSGAPSGVWAGDAGAISVADLASGVGPPGGAQTGKVLEGLYGAAGNTLAARGTLATGAALAAGDASSPQAVVSAGRHTLEAMSAIDARLARDARGKYVVYAPLPGVNYDLAYELGRPLKTLAQLIKMDLGLQAATVDLGGWDTHEYQPGRFRNQVERLSQGLGAFYNDMARYHDRLVVVVVTEFGRRLRSNRSNGTDHGRGSVMMVLGGQVAGGRIYGRWPGLKSEQLEEGVDLAVVNDYRQSLTEVIGHWRGSAHATGVFPGYQSTANLGLFA